ncbi:hypothetical protein BGZ73_005816 [Actinomortierella ambigua]|nr:hypothetical protein BGZ73_005816 [Actinomortierella ambigua]
MADLIELFQAAEDNDPEAQLALAGRFENENYPLNIKKFITYWYYKAASQGHVEAQAHLAALFTAGRAVPSLVPSLPPSPFVNNNNSDSCRSSDDDKENDNDYLLEINAMWWLQEAAYNGHDDAQNSLGLRYSKGSGVPQDDRKAVYWYRQAANQGNVLAQYNLGIMYDNRSGIDPSEIDLADNKAAQWYQLAADKGYAGAQTNLGLLYDEGRGVEKSDIQAAYWYRQAAWQSDSWGQNNLAYMKAVAKNEPDALLHLKWIEAMDVGQAEETLDSRSNNEDDDDDNDPILYNNDHNGGHADADVVGDHDETDKDKNHVHPIDKYREAAEHGDPAGQYNLGLMYEKGIGWPKDFHLAPGWFRKAAAQNHYSAQQRAHFLERKLGPPSK